MPKDIGTNDAFIPGGRGLSWWLTRYILETRMRRRQLPYIFQRGNMQRDLVLERRTVNKLNEEITRRKIRRIAGAGERNSQLNFKTTAGKLREPELVFDEDANCEMYLYRVKIRLEKRVTTGREDVAMRAFDHVTGVVNRTAESEGWKIVKQIGDLSRESTVDDEDPLTISSSKKSVSIQEFDLPQLNAESWERHFSGIYERDAHIRLIHDSTKTFIASQGKTRSHVLMWGPPAGGKTTLGTKFKEFYEQDTDREVVAIIDGPTMSKAGLENWLLDQAERGSLPPIVFIEEIEKQDMDNLLTMLSVMASGYVAKMNARVGRLIADAPCVVWATCNDIDILKRFRRGALLSRFSQQVYCKRPSRDLMLRILQDKVKMIGGNPIWAQKAMDFAYEELPQYIGEAWEDPRRIISLLDGGARLEDGSYQSDLIQILSDQMTEERKENGKTSDDIATTSY